MESYFSGKWKDQNFENLKYSGYQLVDYVNDQKPSSVIDVGCGYNRFKGKINRLVGIDPYNPAADDFGIGRPNVVQPYKPNPLVDNIINVSPRFNPFTALTDRFTKPIDRGPMPNARTQRRNKGGDVKKYAVGGVNKGMTKSRTKYGIVDNKKK